MPEVVDISGTRDSDDPHVQLQHAREEAAARGGVDILRLARLAWIVCACCGGMCGSDMGGGSTCCQAVLLVRGWS